MCCGLPSLRCQKHPEVERLLALGGGIQYQAGGFAGLAKALNELAADRNKLTQMSATNQKLAQERFLRSRSYLAIKELIKKLL